MIYVYRERASDGARALAEAVGGMKVRHLPRVRRGDILVCWGESAPNMDGIRVLNGSAIRTKFEDAVRLREQGVPTIEVSRTRPVERPAPPVTFDVGAGGRLTREQVQALVGRLNGYLAQPQQPPQQMGVWIPRRFYHVGGNDLLRPPADPQYFSRKEDLTEEYRIHCFMGKSIRAGVKVPRDGARPHEWIRSLDGGWRIRYDEFHSRKPQRELAARALTALGLDFGAVDIGRKRDGTFIVLEVNRAPGLEGNTITAYAEAIRGIR